MIAEWIEVLLTKWRSLFTLLMTSPDDIESNGGEDPFDIAAFRGPFF